MGSNDSIKNIALQAVQANKDHQYALKVYAERLESELQTVDKLLTLADVDDQEDEPDLDVGGFILIPGSKKPVGLVPSSELLTEDSPFCADAQKRSRYLNLTSIHPMKSKELEVLAEAVRTENCRLQAFEAQRRGQLSFTNSDFMQINLERNSEGLDWERIADRVSAATSTTRSARECEVRWLGDKHPDINHASWSQTEVTQLKAIIAKLPEGRLNWVQIAKDLSTNRSPIDCMRHGLQRMGHIWDPDSDNRLMECVETYGLDNWNLVARHVSEDATATGCQGRYYRTLDPELKRGNWTAEEDEKLRHAVAVYGKSWVDVAAFIPGRNNDQCRERWNDHVDPAVVKGRWTDEEDKRLLQEAETSGTKWKEISVRMGNGRTDSMCRTRHYLLVKRKSKVRSTSLADIESGLQEIQSPKPGQVVEEPRCPDLHPSPQQCTKPHRPKPKPRTKRKAKEVDTEEDVGVSPQGAYQPITNPGHDIDGNVDTLAPSEDIQAVPIPARRSSPREIKRLVVEEPLAAANSKPSRRRNRIADHTELC